MRSAHMTSVISALLLSALSLAGCEEGVGEVPETADAAEGLRRERGQAEVLEFDVAEDMSRFLFDDAPLHPDGMPAAGNAFVTRGYLYPHGFLKKQAGTTEDGAPAHPEAVIGEWTCRGVFVGDGAHTATGPVVITTQIYDLYAEPGYDPEKQGTGATVISEGYELIDVGEPIVRAITGGSGDYRSSTGEMVQRLLGFNEAEGVNLRVELDLD